MGGWTFPYFDEFSGAQMSKQMKGQYDLLLGRNTYDIFASYWPKHAEGWPQVNTITKYVVSTTLEKPPWQHTVVVKDIEALKKVKDATGPALQVYGSATLVHTLLKEDLVDELWLKIFPVILGKGKKLFVGGEKPSAFTLKESDVSPSGVIFAYYKRAGEVKTGSF